MEPPIRRGRLHGALERRRTAGIRGHRATAETLAAQAETTAERLETTESQVQDMTALRTGTPVKARQPENLVNLRARTMPEAAEAAGATVRAATAERTAVLEAPVSGEAQETMARTAPRCRVSAVKVEAAAQAAAVAVAETTEAVAEVRAVMVVCTVEAPAGKASASSATAGWHKEGPT